MGHSKRKYCPQGCRSLLNLLSTAQVDDYFLLNRWFLEELADDPLNSPHAEPRPSVDRWRNSFEFLDEEFVKMRFWEIETLSASFESCGCNVGLWLVSVFDVLLMSRRRIIRLDRAEDNVDWGL